MITVSFHRNWSDIKLIVPKADKEAMSLLVELSSMGKKGSSLRVMYE